MYGIQIWNGAEQRKDLRAEVHLNLTKMPQSRLQSWFGRQRQYYLDIGLLISDLDSSDKIAIFLPYQVVDTDVLDLGIKLANPRTMNAVFNGTYGVTDKGKTIEIVDPRGEREDFQVYVLDVGQDVLIEEEFGGTVLTLSTGKNCDGPRYFRIRVCSDSLGRLLARGVEGDRLAGSVSTNTDVIDFRINEPRGLQDNLREHLGSKGQLQISKLHFVVLVPVGEHVVSFGASPVCRRLESTLWDEYFDFGKNRPEMSVYHWKLKGAIAEADAGDGECVGTFTSFSQLLEITSSSASVAQVAFYLALIALSGVIGNYLGAWPDSMVGKTALVFALVSLSVALYLIASKRMGRMQAPPG